MTNLFRITLLIGVLIYFGIIIVLMRKHRMSLKYSLVWFLTGAILFVCALFPQVVQWVAKMMGVYSEVNVVFFLGICFLLIIILSLTSIASLHSERLRNLTQTQAILEKRVRELEQQLHECKKESQDGGEDEIHR